MNLTQATTSTAPATPSESTEMYLKTLAELGAGLEPIPIARVAERLGVTQVSANEMMKRLAERDLLAHLPYKGVTLTAAGRRLAHDVIRRQRLWECFLVDQLGIAWERAYELACSLEHATAPEVADALAEYLGQPTLCPHGYPIPDRNGRLASVSGILLTNLATGQPARVTAVFPESTAVLAYLAGHGIRPQQQITIRERAPLDGPLLISAGAVEIALGLNLASLILVTPLASTNPAELEKNNAMNNAIPLSTLAPGELSTITHIGGSSALRRRCLEMGIVKGEAISVERVAPLGDPVAYLVKGYCLSLRRADAEQILVTKGGVTGY
jgi:DtxR family transcriptional regulator, Mn-dependent transcriptional regulator